MRQDTKTILHKIEYEARRHNYFNREEKYVAHVLWSPGSRLLRKGIPEFKAYPYIAYMSPEINSGKTRALEFIYLLNNVHKDDKGHDLLPFGSFSTA